jgi:1,4-dihydroxy-2-naphthoyl-CoA hydrolase
VKHSIWFNKDLDQQKLESFFPDTMGAYLDMRCEEIGDDFLKLSMPVDGRTKQPYGLLHGGASCALAETAGSVGSHLIINPEEFLCVGLEINANHLRSASGGRVMGIAKPLHIGNTTHVWDIRITNDQQQLICVSRLTVAILKRKK